jgi:hypothetical protein
MRTGVVGVPELHVVHLHPVKVSKGVIVGHQVSPSNRITFAENTRIHGNKERRDMPGAQSCSERGSVLRQLRYSQRRTLGSACTSGGACAPQEEAARRIAWAAVKRSYVKIGDRWVAREGVG